MRPEDTELCEKPKSDTPRTDALLQEHHDDRYPGQSMAYKQNLRLQFMIEHALNLERELASREYVSRESVIEEAAKVCQQIADECDARADADQSDTRSHFWGGGARQCQHAVRRLRDISGDSLTITKEKP